MRGVSASLRREARVKVLQARDLGRRASDMLDCPSYTEANLLEDIHAVLAAHASRELAQIDVSALSGGGIRMGPLADAGYRSVEDVYQATPSKLAELPGVGEKSAWTLVRRARAAHDEAMRGTAVHLDAEARPEEHTQLVRNLFWQERLEPLAQPIEQLRSRLDALLDEADAAACLTGVFKLLFAERGSIERGLLALRRIDAELGGLTREVDDLGYQVLQVISTPAQDIWEDFGRRAADYYAKIAALAPVAERRRAGDLPEDLAQRVDAFALDTTQLTAILRPYQAFGAKFALLQERTLIGDEMGLGKTVEAIAAMVHLAAQGGRHFMVVCPLSVLVNWERELPRHSALIATEVYGDSRDAELARWCEEGGVAVTTYETTLRLDWSLCPQVELLVVDEAHYAKNPSAKRSQAVAALIGRSRRVVLLSGTPLENRVGEMTALMGLLDQDLAKELAAERVSHNPVAYRRAIAKRYLRRRREDVLGELPDRIDKTDWCVMSATDRKDYLDALASGGFSDLRRVGWRHGSLGESAKAERLRELVAEAREGGRKVLVYTYFLHTLGLVEELFGDDCAGVISGSVPARLRQEMVDEFTEGQRHVLACQVTSGGLGLNIQAASVVIFCEPQLKPSAEEQAVSRALRMGQVRTVVVHRLLMADSVDERIDELLRAKEAVFAEYAQRSEVAEQEREVFDLRNVRLIIAEELARHGVEREDLDVQDVVT